MSLRWLLFFPALLIFSWVHSTKQQNTFVKEAHVFTATLCHEQYDHAPVQVNFKIPIGFNSTFTGPKSGVSRLLFSRTILQDVITSC